MKRVRKAVIPVAGLGTRFLPATKAMPKEMLTVVDRPVVQYAVDEAFEAGVEHVVFVTGRNKGAIEDHFDQTPELTQTLERSGKAAHLRMLEERFKTPVFIDNDVVMLYFQAAQELNMPQSEVTLCFFIGTGLGNLIVLDPMAKPVYTVYSINFSRLMVRA